MDEQQQELLMKFQFFEQQMRMMQEQLSVIERESAEMNSMKSDLDEVPKSVGVEFLAPMGKGIFAKSKMTDDELIVDIGNNLLVKRSVPETQKIIEVQVKKLEEIRGDLNKNLEEIHEEMGKLIQEAQS